MLNGSIEIDLTINGADARITGEPETPLLYILRNDLRLNAPKYGCGKGECGACAVLIDGDAARSCTVRAGQGALAERRCRGRRKRSGRCQTLRNGGALNE